MIKRKMITIKNDLISLNDEGDNPLFPFLCFLLWPFIENYWMVSASLFSLYPNESCEEIAFLSKIQLFAETLYYQGELSFFESVSKDMSKQALTRFLERQVIERREINDSGLAIIQLAPSYQINIHKLQKLVEGIGAFRRKGKYSKEKDFSVTIQQAVKLISVGVKKAKL